MEKENPNLITVFICFLRSGLRFTRFDTNNVGLAFIDEIKKHNPNFEPEKVQQRERDQIYTVNAYPKEFEQLIMSLIEEYRIKHKMEYRLKKPKGGSRGGFNRNGGNRQSGYRGTNNDVRRPRQDTQRGGDTSSGFRPRRSYDEQQGGSRPSGGLGEANQRSGGTRPRIKPNAGQNQNADTPMRFFPNSDGEEANKRPRRPRKDMDE